MVDKKAAVIEIPIGDCWHVTEDELDKLAAIARYNFQITSQEDGYAETWKAWGMLPKAEKVAWMNAVTMVLFEVDRMGHTSESVVVDYD